MIAHSGIGTVLRNLLPFLIGDGNLRVTLMGERAKLSVFPWFVPDCFIPLEAGIYSPKEQVELSARIPACDIFWSPHYNVPLFPIRARKRLVTIHDAFHLAFPRSLSLPKRIYARLLMGGAVRHSDAVATVSEFSKTEIAERLGIDPGRISMIPNGRDPDYARVTGAPKQEGDYLLFVGNVKPHKNIQGAMRAFMRVSDRHPGLTLRIVGRKEGFITGDPAVEKLAATLAGRVHFTGFVSDDEVKEHYRGARALVFPSFYEGFGLPILEAMSFGIPVISSNRASMPEVGGDAVRYFDPDDADGFVGAIEDVLEKRWAPDAGKYRAQLGKFSWEKTGTRYRELIAGLAAR